MGLLTNIFKTIRPLVPDAMVARGGREYFNRRYGYLGQMTTLKIDAANQRAEFDLDLKGEKEPLHITIKRYELTSVGAKTFIEVKEFETSREWVTRLAESFLKGHKFELPDAVRLVL